MKKFKSEILNVLENNNGRLIDISFAVFKILKESEEQAPTLLKFFFEEAESIMPSEEEGIKQLITDKEVKHLSLDFDDTIDSWLINALEKKPSSKSFYGSLWKYIANNRIYKTDKEKSYALYRIWGNPQIPYFKPESGLRMDLDSFINLAKEMRIERAKARSIIFAKYEQRTEEASVLLKIFEKLETPEEKAMLMAYIIRVVELRTLDEISQNDGKQ